MDSLKGRSRNDRTIARKLMNEAETRAEHIDPALAAAGWGVVEGSRIHREYLIIPGRIEGHGKRGKALTADYVLVYRNQKLAVIEAKAWDKPLTEGVGQAKDYAGKMAVRHAYATNQIHRDRSAPRRFRLAEICSFVQSRPLHETRTHPG